MIDTPQIIETTEQLTAIIHLCVPREEIGKVMGPAIAEVMAVAGAQGVGPVGPWLTHHLRMDPAVFDFEVAVPVSAPVTASGRVRAGRLPAVTVARTVYRGPYEGLGDAWGQFTEWIKANGHTPRTDLWECYVVGTETTSEATNFRTQLNQPLVV